MTDHADTIRREAEEYVALNASGEYPAAEGARIIRTLLAELQQAQEDAKEWKEAFEAAVVQRRKAIDALRDARQWLDMLSPMPKSAKQTIDNALMDPGEQSDG